jgi:hypothetical protein
VVRKVSKSIGVLLCCGNSGFYSLLDTFSPLS